MSLSNKTIANTYKDLLHIDQSGNGMPATYIVTVKDGNGSATALWLGKRGVIIHPTTNTVSTFQVEYIDNNDILAVNGYKDAFCIPQTAEQAFGPLKPTDPKNDSSDLEDAVLNNQSTTDNVPTPEEIEAFNQAFLKPNPQ